MGPYIYELFAVLIHEGTATRGHYYAYIKDFRNEKWQCFNDSKVTHVIYTYLLSFLIYNHVLLYIRNLIVFTSQNISLLN